ncbi:MAG: HAMP domain-containing histidine kinase [Bryobacteraceae bacterium]|nr:HAMP domain-containing histidine kinase [Bryobacteraceae bacterium]
MTWTRLARAARARVGLFAAAAVILGLAGALAWFQARSLLAIERATREVNQAHLGRLAREAAKSLEAGLRKTSEDYLLSLRPEDVGRKSRAELAARFSSWRNADPRIRRVAAVYCGCGREPELLVAGDGTRELGIAAWESRWTQGVSLEGGKDAHSTRFLAGPERSFIASRQIHGPRGAGALVVIEFDSARLAAGLLRDREQGARFALTDSRGLIQQTGEFTAEASAELGRIAPSWRIDAGPAGRSTGDAARQQRTRAMWMLALLLVALAAAMSLAVRAALRELALAELRSEFVAGVSHELKTPLALIRLYAESLDQGRVRPDRRAEYYQVLHRESRRLSEMVENLLDFSRIESGRWKPALRVENLQRVVAAAIDEHAQQLHEAGFQVSTSFPPGDVLAGVDAASLGRAIGNLIDNSIKYSGAAREIAISLVDRDGFAIIEVADRGIGISPAEQPRVFEKFFRSATGEVRAIRGTGIGLSLAREIAAAHAGTIELESEPGAGSRFRIRIPSVTATNSFEREPDDHPAETADRRG